MRPLHLNLAALVLLALCAFLILRSSLQDGPVNKNPKVSAATPRVMPPLPQAKETRVDDTAARAPDHSVTSHATKPPQSPPGPSADKHAPGIQLADDVQLPAVIIALSDPNQDPQHKIPPTVAAAMQRIVDSFYQELAAGVSEIPIAGNPKPTEADGEQTVVIQPGPTVEQARANANDAYRTLFGDETFNQLMMNASLEARLPKNPGQK